MHYGVQISPKFNAEVDVEPFLPLSQMLTSLKSHRYSIKWPFVIVHQEYNDKPVICFYMAEVNHKVAAIFTNPSLTPGRQTGHERLSLFPFLLYNRNRGILLGQYIG